MSALPFRKLAIAALLGSSLAAQAAAEPYLYGPVRGGEQLARIAWELRAAALRRMPELLRPAADHAWRRMPTRPHAHRAPRHALSTHTARNTPTLTFLR